MEVLYARCCGLDVHKSSITACVLIAQTGRPLKHIRRFGSTTRELRELAAWLREFGVEHVAIWAVPAEDHSRYLEAFSLESILSVIRVTVLGDTLARAANREKMHGGLLF